MRCRGSANTPGEQKIGILGMTSETPWTVILLSSMGIMLTGCANHAGRQPVAKTDSFQRQAAPTKEAASDKRAPTASPLRTGPSSVIETSPFQLVGHKQSTDASDGLSVWLQDPLVADEEATTRLEADPATSTVNLDFLLGVAFQSNPALEQADAAIARACGIQCQVGRKANPSVGYFANEIGNDGGAGQHGVFASQLIVRGDKLQWNQRVLGGEVSRLHLEREVVRQRIETDIRVAFYRALVAQRQADMATGFQEDAEEAVEIAKRRLESGDGTRPDLLQSMILLEQVDMSRQTSQWQLRAAKRELDALVGMPLDERVVLVGSFDTKWPESADGQMGVAELDVESWGESNPQWQAAQAAIDVARVELQRQVNQVVPNVVTQLGTGFDDSTGDAFANVQLGVPLPVHNRNRGNIAAARARLNAAQTNADRIAADLRSRFAQVEGDFQTARMRVEKYDRAIVPKAEESLRLVEQAYTAGEVDFLRLLDARQSYFQLNQDRIAAQGELAITVSRLQGYLLSGGLGTAVTFDRDDGLRGQALSGQ